MALVFILMACLLSFSSVGRARIGDDRFFPEHPLQAREKEEITFNVLVPSLFALSEKKVAEETAVSLSKLRWPESGKPMFNVTLLTNPNNHKLKARESDTLHLYTGFDFDPSDFIVDDMPNDA